MSGYWGRLWLAVRGREKSSSRYYMHIDPKSKSLDEAQRLSFAYGNANISNPDVTREMVQEAADRLELGVMWKKEKKNLKWEKKDGKSNEEAGTESEEEFPCGEI